MTIAVGGLGTDVEALGIALGLLERAASGVRLRDDFFTAPANRVGKVVSDPEQREALLKALEGLVPQGDPAALNGRPERRYHPLFDRTPGAKGQLYLTVTRAGAGATATVDLGLAAEATAANNGPSVTGELPLLSAKGSQLAAVAGSSEAPLRIEARVPAGVGGEISASLLLVAPPDEEQSRIAIRIERPGEAPLELDPFALEGQAGRLVAALLQTVVAAAGSTAPQPVRLLADHLPGLLGFDDGLPPLPLGELASDPDAMRGWIAELATDFADDGRSALVAWLDHLGRLLGSAAPVVANPNVVPTEASPLVLPLFAGPPAVALTAAVRTEADGTPVLVLGLQVRADGGTVDAALVAEATVLALPLAGTAPARPLERLNLLVTAPRGTGKLVDEQAIEVGRLRVGAMYDGSTVTPVVELLGVAIELGGGSRAEFDRLDLTDTQTLSSAAQTLLTNAIEAGLGVGGGFVAAIQTLLGLGRTPGIDVTLLPSAPTRALAEYYRTLLGDPAGWSDLIEAVWTLLGGTGSPPVAGAGTRDDPFRVELTHFPGEATAPGLELAFWDDAPGDASVLLRVGLRIGLASAQGAQLTWSAAAQAELFGFDLPLSGPGAVRFLGVAEAKGVIDPPTTPVGETGVSVDAGAVRLGASWRPGSPFAAEARLDDLAVGADGTTIALGSIRLPGATIDPDDPALGLGLDPDALWAALRLLLGRVAGSWGGQVGDMLAALLGAGVPGRPGVPAGLPPLPLPTEGDLRSVLEAPLAALRAWLAELATGADSVAEDGVPFLASLREPLQAILTGNLPPIPGLELPGPDVAPDGAGTRADPWTVPLQPAGADVVELLLWLEPDGPPVDWIDALRTMAEDERLDAAALADALEALRGQLGLDVLAGLDAGTATAALRGLGDALRGTDGVVPVDAAIPVEDGWVDGGTAAAAHHDLSRSPDAILRVLGAIEGWTSALGTDDWAAVLLAPDLAGTEPWSALLASAGRSAEAIELRRPGVDPGLVDLTAVRAASFYTVGLADDGTADLTTVAARLARVVSRIRQVKPNARVVLVGHSYAGVVAQRYAADNPASVLGLVTLGAPLAPVDVAALVEEAAAEGVRLACRLAPAGLADAPLVDSALRHLDEALDGFVQGGPGTPPMPVPYPLSAFLRAPETLPALGAVPAVAIAGAVESDFVGALARAIVLAPPTGSSQLPTHVAYGIRLGLALPDPAADDAVDVDVNLRLDLGRFPLFPGVDEPDHPAERLTVRAEISRPGGWLVGRPGDGTPLTARVRRAEFEGSFVPSATGLESEVDFRLYDAAFKGLGAPLVRLDDPQAPALLAELVRTIDAEAAFGGRVRKLVDALVDLGLVQRGGPGGTALVAATLESLRADGSAYLAERIPALLDRSAGLLGFVRSPGAPAGAGPWAYAHPDVPVEIRVERQPWHVTARTTGNGLELLGGGNVEATATLRLSDLEADAEARLRLGGLELFRADDGRIMLRVPQLQEPVALHPADPTELRQTLAPLLPRILLDAALTALLERLLGGRIGSLDGLIHGPAAWLLRPGALGDGTLPKAEQVNALLAAVARALGLQTGANKPLVLPGELVLSAADTTNGARFSLAMAQPLRFDEDDPASPGVQLAVALDLDRARHASPAGNVIFHVPLPGSWEALDLNLGGSATGPIAFATLQGPGVRVDFLPRVSGLVDLVQAAAQALLPEVLDALVNELKSRQPAPVALGDALTVAERLRIYDPAAGANGFRSRAAELAKLAKDLEAGNLTGVVGAAATAIHTLLRRLLGTALVPAQPTPTSVAVQFTGVLGGTVELSIDLGRAPPSVSLKVSGLTVGVATAGATFSYADPAVTATVSLRAALDTGAGVVLRPQLDAGLAQGALSVALRPLGSQGDVVIPLAPQPAPPSVEDLLKIAEAWVLPLAATLLLREAQPWLTKPLWQPAQDGPPAKTAKDLLVAAGVIDSTAAFVKVPSPPELLAGVLKALTGVDVPLPGGLKLALVEAANRYGLRVGGEVAIPAGGDLAVLLRLGIPEEVGANWGDAGKGPTVYLLDMSVPTTPKVTAAVALGGLGAEIGGANEKPLAARGGFRIGSVAAYARAEIALLGANAFKRPPDLAGAVVLEGLGLPLAPPGGDGGNPVAASLLQTNGGGDKAPVNPPLNIAISAGAGAWNVSFNGKDEVRLPVNRTFGPLHVAELLLQYAAANGDAGRLGLGVDGSVSLAGLQVAVDDLRLLVPLRYPAELDRWKVDLAGLGVSVANPAVSIAGSLLKAELPGGAIEYRGGLAVSVGGRGFSAVGAYARPSDALGRYTSLFVFVSVPIPLGGPPYLFVLGLAGGAGYNRRLLVPREPTSVPAFPLVAAMESGGQGGPLEMLEQIAKDIPPSRGSYWIAAGVKFSTFELIRTTALAYAAIDRNLEVGLLGIMRMALPTADAAVVSVELALAARYSTADQVLSIRAALTRNSWLLSRNCQLTGGFAFVTWFAKPEALLTIGGYHPAFQRPAHYPAVDRVGFHWAVGGGIVVKGEAYFALTHAALMFGGRLEASYDVSPIRVWFIASLDVIVRWDPFHYMIDARVSIGASFRIRICFFACATISISVSLGAAVHLEGPPLYGRVTVDLAIASVTVEFGELKPQTYLPWEQTRVKYLGGGDAAAPGTRTGVLAGVLAREGGDPPNGTEARPWVVASEFAVRSETRMPATALRITGRTAAVTVPFAVPQFVDVVPSGPSVGHTRGALVVAFEARGGTGTWAQLPQAALDALEVTPRPGGFPGGVWKSGAEKAAAAPMVKAIGLVDVRAPLSIREKTGRFGATDVPFSKLVEEEAELPLPLGGDAGPSIPAFVPLLSDVARGEEAEPEPPRLTAVVPPVRAARYVAVAARDTSVTDDLRLTPTRPPRLPPIARLIRIERSVDGAHVNGHRRAVRNPAVAGARPADARERHAALAGAHTSGSGAPIEPGASHVFDLPEGAAERLRIRLSGSGHARVSAFTGTGAPILDVDGSAARLAEAELVPRGAARVVVTSLGAGPAATDARSGVRADAPPATGWQLFTSLLQVAPGTLLAHGATVLTPRPFSPPPGFCREGLDCRVPASVLTAAMPGVTTILPTGAELVVVQLDRRTDVDGLGDLAVAVEDGTLGEPVVLASESRTTLLYPVTGTNGAPLRVSVASVADWRLAGVVALRGRAGDWADALSADALLRLVDDTPTVNGGGEQVRIRLASRRARSRAER